MSMTTPISRRPGRIRRVILAGLAGLAALASETMGACPAPVASPLTVSNLGAREASGHEFLILRGRTELTARTVRVTREGSAGAPAESSDWPADSGIYKAVVRLAPGDNTIQVSAAGLAPVCVEVAYRPNPLPVQALFGVIVLAADQGEGPGLFAAPAGEPNDLASVRKRIAFGLSLAQAAYGELLRRGGHAGKSLAIKTDAQGRPNLRVFKSRRTKAQLQDLERQGKAADSVWKEVRDAYPGPDKPAVFPMFSGGNISVSHPGPWFNDLGRIDSWPQGVEELAARLADARPGECDCLAEGGRMKNTMASDFTISFGEWFRTVARNLERSEVDDVVTRPDYVSHLFALREQIYQEGARLVSAEKIGVNVARLPAFLSGGFMQGPLATLPARSAGDLLPGLTVAYYEGGFARLPDFKGPAASVSASPGLAFGAFAQRENFALRYTGWIRVPAGGPHRFHLTSDDGSRMYLDDTLVIDNDGLHGPETRSVSLNLAPGLHAFRLEYFNRTGAGSLDIKWDAAHFPGTVLPDTLFFRDAVSTGLGLEGSAFPSPLLVHSRTGGVQIIVASAQDIRLIPMDAAGRRASPLFSGRLPAGTHFIPVPEAMGCGTDLLLVETPAGSSALRAMSLRNGPR